MQILNEFSLENMLKMGHCKLLQNAFPQQKSNNFLNCDRKKHLQIPNIAHLVRSFDLSFTSDISRRQRFLFFKFLDVDMPRFYYLISSVDFKLCHL